MPVIEIGEYLPLPDGFVRRRPPYVAKRPSDRHDVMRFTQATRGRPGDRNAMICPEVDVQADIDAINDGVGFFRAETARIWVNGRIWGMHVERQSGTIYPVEGDGFFSVTQLQYRAMRIIASHKGINERSEHEMARLAILSDLDREIARAVWRMREEAKDGNRGRSR